MCAGKFDPPQGLKPNVFDARNGTAEAVPFQIEFMKPVLGLHGQIWRKQLTNWFPVKPSTSRPNTDIPLDTSPSAATSASTAPHLSCSPERCRSPPVDSESRPIGRNSATDEPPNVPQPTFRPRRPTTRPLLRSRLPRDLSCRPYLRPPPIQRSPELWPRRHLSALQKFHRIDPMSSESSERLPASPVRRRARHSRRAPDRTLRPARALY